MQEVLRRYDVMLPNATDDLVTGRLQSQQHRSDPEDGHSSAHDARIDEDDLLALLGSDTFSLESARDRDLNVLSSFLSKALPNQNGMAPNSASIAPSRPKARHYNSQQASFAQPSDIEPSSLNGIGEIQTPLGTPASFNGNLFFAPPPANSYSSQYYGTSPEQTLHTGFAIDSRWRGSNQPAGQMNGYRAPAPSRSRDRSNWTNGETAQPQHRRNRSSTGTYMLPHDEVETDERPSRIPESSCDDDAMMAVEDDA